MNRALKLALAAAVVIAIAVYVVTRGGPSEAAIPAATTRIERERAKAEPTLAETPELYVASVENAQRSVAGAEEELGTSFEILGRVVDELDRPIEEFAIQAIHRDEHNVFVEKRVWPSAIHKSGEFELRDLAPGYWDIVPFADDLTRPDVRSFTSSPAERIVFKMSGSALIDGVVLDADGWPVANASVRVAQCETQSNDEGKFELRLSPGAYRMHAEATGYALSDEFEFRVATRDHIAGVRLGLNRFALLRGVVLDEKGAPLRGWRISARGRLTPLAGATSDERGGFELAVGKPETLTIRALDDSKVGSAPDDTRSSRPPNLPISYTTTLLASDVGRGRVMLRLASIHNVHLRATILRSDHGAEESEAKVNAYISVEALDGRLIRDAGSYVVNELTSTLEMRLPTPGRYLFRFYGDGRAELGSQIVEVPERDEFEVTLSM